MSDKKDKMKKHEDVIKEKRAILKKRKGNYVPLRTRVSGIGTVTSQ